MTGHWIKIEYFVLGFCAALLFQVAFFALLNWLFGGDDWVKL